MSITGFDLTVNIIESIIYILFLVHYFRMKPNFNRIYFVLWVLIKIVSITFINIYIGYGKYWSIVEAIISYFPFLLLFAEGSIWEKGYITFFTAQLFAVITTGASIIFSLIIYQKVDLATLLDNHYIFMVVSVHLIYLFVSQFLAYQRRKIKSSLQPMILVGFIAFIFVSQFIYTSLEDILYEGVINIGDISISLICLLLWILAVFFVFFKVQITNENNLENELKIQALNYQSDLSGVVLEVNRETNRIQHDLKHFLSHVEFLLEQHKEEEALAVVKQQHQEVKKERKVILTPNEVITYVLNTKNGFALETGISMRFIINFTHNIEMNEVELVVLLGNAIDNAIENNNGDDVEIRMEDKNEYLCITISNAIKESVLENNVGLKTTKQERGHGYGIESMKKIMNRNEGRIDFFEKNDRFNCVILLK